MCTTYSNGIAHLLIFFLKKRQKSAATIAEQVGVLVKDLNGYVGTKNADVMRWGKCVLVVTMLSMLHGSVQ